MFNGVLNFSNKLHKSIYDGGCTKVYKDYDVDDEARHAFVTAFSFKAKQMAWGGDNGGILDIPQGVDPSGNPVFKFLLDSDGEFTLRELQAYVSTFINTDTRASQDDAMVWSCALDSLSSIGQVKIYSRSAEYKVLGTESGLLLLKVILMESGLHTNASIIKHKHELENLPVLMGKLSHNVEKFNSNVLSIVLALKRKGATAPDLLHQLFPAYLHCPDKNFAIYVGSKRDKFE